MTDFSDCEFISQNMNFYTYEDFVNARNGIKRLYNGLSRNGKLFYKWYVYANTHMELYFKNAIWDYLNFPDEQYVERLIELKSKCKK